MPKPKSFRPWVPEQRLLLPPSAIEWLPADHLVFFLLGANMPSPRAGLSKLPTRRDAAVDRLVDHSTIIQFNGESDRRKRARRPAGSGHSGSNPRLAF